MTSQAPTKSFPPLRIFLSYSHDSKKHRIRIRRLAEQLAGKGFNCKLDQFEADPPEGWPEWSERQIADADVVMVIFTKGYVNKAERKTASGTGRGVCWEWKLIRQHLYDAQSADPRFVPVIFSQGDEKYVATALRGNQIYRLYQSAGIDVLVERLQPRKRAEPVDYPGLYSLAGYQTGFVPLMNRKPTDALIFKLHQISIVRSALRYELPAAFLGTKIEAPFKDLPGCRLLHYSVTNPSHVEFSFSCVNYSDYLKSGEHLDDPLPDDPKRTFREEFAKLVPLQDINLRHFQLTNICGVGLFVVTADDNVLICRHSGKAHVYPSRWTFSASGTMRWGAWPNPFTEAIWKCRQEINHQVNPVTFPTFGGRGGNSSIEACLELFGAFVA